MVIVLGEWVNVAGFMTDSSLILKHLVFSFVLHPFQCALNILILKRVYIVLSELEFFFPP